MSLQVPRRPLQLAQELPLHEHGGQGQRRGLQPGKVHLQVHGRVRRKRAVRAVPR